MGSWSLLTRRRFLTLSALGATAAGAELLWIEPNRIYVSEHLLGKPSGNRQPLRLVQLSDLHLQKVGSHAERIARTVQDLAPDVILLTGDTLDRADRFETLADFLRLLPASRARYAILGNWEHQSRADLTALRRLYAEFDVQLLVNQSARLEHEGCRLLISGLDDATAGAPSLAEALAGVEPEANHLLLAHSPIYRDRLAREARGDGNREASSHRRDAPGSAGVDLQRYRPQYMLSGHTHGGQVNLLGWAPIRPWGSGTYVRGWYRDRWPHLYVSQGIGTSRLPIRFGAPPEVALFEWHLRDGPGVP